MPPQPPVTVKLRDLTELLNWNPNLILLAEDENGQAYKIKGSLIPGSGGGAGSGDITIEMVSGLPESLAAKVGTASQGLTNPSAWRTALGIDTLNIVDAVAVANQTARLALSADAARNALVKEADTGRSYMLISGGVPSNNANWLLISDVTLGISDITGLATALASSAVSTIYQTPDGDGDSVNLWKSGFYTIRNTYAAANAGDFYAAVNVGGGPDAEAGIVVVNYENHFNAGDPGELDITINGAGYGTLRNGDVAICVPIYAPEGSWCCFIMRAGGSDKNEIVMGNGSGITDAAAFRTALGLDSLNLVDAVPVANQAARLALTADQARNALVKQADNGKSYMLTSSGVPTNNSDWIEIGDAVIAMADVTGLTTAINTINSQLADLALYTPFEGEEVPKDANRAVEIDTVFEPMNEFNGIYEEAGLIFNFRPVLTPDPDPGTMYSSNPHFIYQNGRWEFWNQYATRIAYSEANTDMWPSTGQNWTLEDGVTEVFDSGELRNRSGWLGTLPSPSRVIVYQGIEYHYEGFNKDGFDLWRWVPFAQNAIPYDENQAGIAGYERYVMGGTTIPATSGTILYEVPVSILNGREIWCSGEYNFLEIPPAVGIWILMKRHETIPGSWEVQIYQNGFLSQSYRSLPDSGGFHPPFASNRWQRTSGSSSAGMTLTRSISDPLPGKVGQTVTIDFLTGDPRVGKHYLCVRDKPYSTWVELATDPSETGMSLLRAPSDQAAREAIDAFKQPTQSEFEPGLYAELIVTDPVLSTRAGNYSFAGHWVRDNGYRTPVFPKTSSTIIFDELANTFTGTGFMFARERSIDVGDGQPYYRWYLLHSTNWATTSPTIAWYQTDPSDSPFAYEFPHEVTAWSDAADEPIGVTVTLDPEYIDPLTKQGDLFMQVGDGAPYLDPRGLFVARRTLPTVFERVPGYPFGGGNKSVDEINAVTISGDYFLQIAQTRTFYFTVSGNVTIDVAQLGDAEVGDRGEFLMVLNFEDNVSRTITFPSHWILKDGSDDFSNRLATFVIRAVIKGMKVFYSIESYFAIDEADITNTVYAMGDLGQDTGPSFTQGVNYLLSKASEMDYLLYAGDVNYDVGAAADMAGNLGGLSALVTAEKILPTHGNHDWATVAMNWTTDSTPMAIATAGWRYTVSNVFSGDWKTNAATSSGWTTVTTTGVQVPGFGEGDSAGITNSSVASYYITRVLNLGSAPAAGKKIRISMYIDDGAQVYINGVKVYEFNMIYPVSHTSLAKQAISATVDNTMNYTERALHVIYVDASVLVSGNNLIAVLMKQSSTSSSDLSWDMSIDIGSTTGKVPLLTDDIKFTSGRGGPLRDTFSYIENGMWAYHRTIGDCADVFVMEDGFNNAGTNENPLGPHADGAMHQWFVDKLATTTRPFKIVVLHRCCVSSYDSSLYWSSTLDWPEFKDPSVLLVFGHTHQTNHYTHTSGQQIINASNCGGQASRAIDTLVGNTTGYTVAYADGSSSNYAVARIDLSPDFLRVRFEKTLDGTVLHEFVMPAP